MSETGRNPYIDILRTIVIAVVSGFCAALIVALFAHSLGWLIGLLDPVRPPLRAILPIIGALVVGSLILRRDPAAGGEGVQFYITAVNIRGGRLNLRETILRFPATVLTLGLFGSGGTVGPLVRMCAGAGSFIIGRSAGRTGLARHDGMTLGAICGVSGAISAIFHAPLAAGLYATEVLQRESIRYTDLIVALISAIVAFVTSSLVLGEQPYFSFHSPAMELSGPQMAWLPLIAVLSGLTGLLFIHIFRLATSAFHMIPWKQPAPSVAASLILSLAILLGMDVSLRTSPELYRELAAGGTAHISSLPLYAVHIILPLLLLVLAKIMLTSVTVGCGMSAGFTGPLIIMGMTLGAAASYATGADPAGGAYYGYMACATAALLSATLNIPLAAIALTTTLFGTSYILPAVTGSSIAFILFKGITIYRYYGSGEESAPRGQERTHHRE